MKLALTTIFLAACVWHIPAKSQNLAPSTPGAIAVPAAAPEPEMARLREQIATQRLQAQALYDSSLAGCYQQFAVNDCLDGLRAQRRDSMADLRRQEIELNNQERRAAAAQRVQSVSQNVEHAQQHKLEKAAKEAAEPVPTPFKTPQTQKSPTMKNDKPPSAKPGRGLSNAGVVPKRPSPTVAAPLPVKDRTHKRAQAAQSASLRVQRSEHKQAALLAAQEAALRRAQDRLARGAKPVAALPLPP